MTSDLLGSGVADTPNPTELRAPEGAMQMEIDWEDGQTSLLPHAVLRGFCPCAHCQGHGGTIRFIEGASLELADIGEVGSYAVSLRWGDGHSTGIYSFRFLKELGALATMSAEQLRDHVIDRR